MDARDRLNQQRIRRRHRVRRRVRGTAGRPRLTVFRSARHIGAQIINDELGTTIVSASTLQKDIAGDLGATGNCKAAQKVGAVLAQRALDAGVSTVAFDRGHYRYHGRVAALANAVREGGLKL